MKYFAVMVDVSVDLTGTKKNIFFEIAKHFTFLLKTTTRGRKKLKRHLPPAIWKMKFHFGKVPLTLLL